MKLFQDRFEYYLTYDISPIEDRPSGNRNVGACGSYFVLFLAEIIAERYDAVWDDAASVIDRWHPFNVRDRLVHYARELSALEVTAASTETQRVVAAPSEYDVGVMLDEIGVPSPSMTTIPENRERCI